MAKGYALDGTTLVDVPALGTTNTFTGTQTFVGAENATSVSTGTVRVSGGMGVTKNICADAVYGAVWNDLVDCIDVPEYTDLEPGYAYCFNGKDYYKSPRYLADNFIGIHSDTSGFAMGRDSEKKQLFASVAGFVLAHVDKEYAPGTPLTITAGGELTAIKEEDIAENFYKIVATFWKPEYSKTWGDSKQKINVNKRYWVKIQ